MQHTLVVARGCVVVVNTVVVVVIVVVVVTLSVVVVVVNCDVCFVVVFFFCESAPARNLADSRTKRYSVYTSGRYGIWRHGSLTR